MSARATSSQPFLPASADRRLRKANSLLEKYSDVRNMTETLCAPLSADDQMVQSTPEASPVKWHQAHTTWFFETFILSPHLAGYEPIDPAFRSLFNSYYKQVGSHPLRTTRSAFSRPSLEQVQQYRHYVDEQMQKLLGDKELSPALGELVEIGLNHEQQHQELIVADLKHALWSNPLRPAYFNSASRIVESPALRVADSQWVRFEGGLLEIGYAGKGFAFDNEGPRHKVWLEPFRLASRLVTNGEYLEFMRAGGYQKPELWLSDGWDCVQANQWDAPLYWLPDSGGAWLHFTLSGACELRSSEPVCHVSLYEADAYARWAGARLPREEEWEVAAAQLPVEGNFLERGSLHPESAGPVPPGGRNVLQQLFGDVWEWTCSPYVAYPGFRPAAGALGEYNGKFMCNQMVLRGGSCATPQSHMRASYRNFFPPPMRWQFMGIRLADGCD